MATARHPWATNREMPPRSGPLPPGEGPCPRQRGVGNIVGRNCPAARPGCRNSDDVSSLDGAPAPTAPRGAALFELVGGAGAAVAVAALVATGCAWWVEDAQ